MGSFLLRFSLFPDADSVQGPAIYSCFMNNMRILLIPI